MIVVINPGTGPIDDSTEENAVIAMKQFAKDTGSERFTRRNKRHDEIEGRFAFMLYRRNSKGVLREFEIDMPGVPVENVRYIGPPQNIWHYPRLYVNGSSWVWKFAVSQVTDETDE